jgi:hypothetical protein
VSHSHSRSQLCPPHFSSPAAARPYPSAQIEKIFKAHAAENPVLNEKLEEFLTLAAVVRSRAACRPCHRELSP